MSGSHIVTFSNSVPGARHFAESIAHNPSIQALNQTVWLFSLVEIAHLLFLVMIGGSTLVLSLRTLGVTLGDVALDEVANLTRPWLRAGTIGGIVSGVFMATATALTLAGSGAFVIKLLALTAAILFGIALAGRLRGGKRAVQIALASVGFVSLAQGLWLFGSTHILAAGAMLIGTLFGVFLLVVSIARARATRVEQGDRFAQVLAVGTVIAWLTVAAGGRWIGFS